MRYDLTTHHGGRWFDRYGIFSWVAILNLGGNSRLSAYGRTRRQSIRKLRARVAGTHLEKYVHS